MNIVDYGQWYYLIYLIPGGAAVLTLILSVLGGGRHHRAGHAGGKTDAIVKALAANPEALKAIADALLASDGPKSSAAHPAAGEKAPVAVVNTAQGAARPTGPAAVPVAPAVRADVVLAAPPASK